MDEALRMSEHPGILFRPGPTGRRAGLVAGPDVWEVIRAVKSARAHEPDLAEDGMLTLVAENTGVPARLVRAAVRYWASYPGDIDAEMTAAEAAGDAAEEAWRRERDTANIKDFMPLGARYRAASQIHAGLILVHQELPPGPPLPLAARRRLSLTWPHRPLK